MHPLAIRVVILFSVLTTAAGCAVTSPRHKGPLAKFENSLVFAPTRYPVGNWQPRGLSFEDVWFTAADGTRLHGWYLPHPNPRAAVLFALAFPALLTWVYFVALAQSAAAVQQAAYALGKVVQFGFPLVWVLAVQRRRLHWQGPGRAGTVAGRRRRQGRRDEPEGPVNIHRLERLRA